MLKKSLSAFSVILILFLTISVHASAQDSDFVIDNGVLVRYNGSGGAVAVPDGVTSIGEYAFASIASVTSVKLPSSVTTIEKTAFSGCINLASITLSTNLTDIGDYAFESCQSLLAITIPERIKNIGLAAFADCKSLTSVTVNPYNSYYSSVSGVMFDKNQSVLVLYPAGKTDSSYTIPDSVATIGAYAFCRADNLESVIIPDSVTTIEAHAFDSCKKLTSVTIPDSVRSIGQSAFMNSGLTAISLPDSVTSIADWAFALCHELTSVTIPDNITHIGNASFQGCANLTSVTVSGNVISIGWEAFNSCPALTSVIIPDSVKSIGSGAFYLSDKAIIYGIKNSSAHQYAKDNYIKFAEYTINDDGSIKLDSSVTQTAPQPFNTTFNASFILNKLGLFNGVGTDSQGNPIFELEREPSRQEALVMLIRLLGLEKTALASTTEHPFEDVAAWASPYVGYAYSVGLTNGTGPNTFGGDDLATLQQYSTFLLRALGYSEKDNDFTYTNALDKAYELGIISSKAAETFTRGEVAELSYNVLLLPRKGEANALANKLLWEDVFTTDQLNETHNGKLMLAADMPDLIHGGAIVYNLEDLRDLLYLCMRNTHSGIEIHVPGFTGEQIKAVYDDIVNAHYRKLAWNPSIIYWHSYIYAEIMVDDALMMEYYYQNPARYQKNYKFYRTDLITYSGITVTLAGWVYKVDGIINEQITPFMSQKEKVKALHDYLVLNTMYDRAAEGKITSSPHFAKQVIFEGSGVCDGYSEAFKILMNAAGIECKEIYGDTPYGRHAWNQVKIDGIWYNIDVTWDDPDDGSRISYDYFCISDENFLKDHQPDGLSEPETCLHTLK